MIIQNILDALNAKDVHNRYVQFEWNDENYMRPISAPEGWTAACYGAFAVQLNADFSDDDGELLGVYNIIPVD